MQGVAEEVAVIDVPEPVHAFHAGVDRAVLVEIGVKGEFLLLVHPAVVGGVVHQVVPEARKALGGRMAPGRFEGGNVDFRTWPVRAARFHHHERDHGQAVAVGYRFGNEHGVAGQVAVGVGEPVVHPVRRPGKFNLLERFGIAEFLPRAGGPADHLPQVGPGQVQGAFCERVAGAAALLKGEASSYVIGPGERLARETLLRPGGGSRQLPDDGGKGDERCDAFHIMSLRISRPCISPMTR